MQKLIYVAPAASLLVPYEPHRPGQYIGVRHATAEERAAGIGIVAEAPGGHAYVVADPPFAQVVWSPYYERGIAVGDLTEVSAEDAAAYLKKIGDAHDEIVKAATPPAPSVEHAPKTKHTKAPPAPSGEETGR